MEFNNRHDDDLDYDQLRTKSNEIDYPDELPPCDSSGAEKTVLTSSTASTEAMTADDDSDDASDDDKSLNDENEEKVIGILRRDEYYPSFDSPQRNNNIVLPIKLDYLEHRVKDLQDKKENSRKSDSEKVTNPTIDHLQTMSDSNTLPPSPRRRQVSGYPVQMARSNIEAEAMKSGEPVKTNRGITSPSEISKRHPTAARLQNLKKTAAWKRRFGKQ